jgi:hypothetical protein
MTIYDEMTTDELQAAYELRFGQRYPDESLLLRRVLKLDAELKAAYATIATLQAAQQEPQP